MRRTVELLALEDAIEKCAASGGMTKEARNNLLETLGRWWQSGLDTASDIKRKTIKLKDDVVGGVKRTGNSIYDFFSKTPEVLDRADRKLEGIVDRNIVQPYKGVERKVNAAKDWYLHGVDLTMKQLQDIKDRAYNSTIGRVKGWWDDLGKSFNAGRKIQNKNWEE